MRLEMPCVETQRLLLRPVEEEDVADLFEIYCDARVMLGNASVGPFISIDEMLEFLKKAYMSYRQLKIPQAMVMEKLNTGKVIGILEYHTIRGDIGELGYLLAYSYWHNGYMQEAIQTFTALGFYYLGLRRIEAQFKISNRASERVLTRCGFHKEGVLRKVMKLNDKKYHDLVICSLLKDECEELKVVFDTMNLD